MPCGHLFHDQECLMPVIYVIIIFCFSILIFSFFQTTKKTSGWRKQIHVLYVDLNFQQIMRCMKLKNERKTMAIRVRMTEIFC